MRFLAALLVLAALTPSAFADEALPPNTINCSDFKKNSSGSWEASDATFEIGSQHFHLQHQVIQRHLMAVGPSAGSDLFDLIESKCAQI